MRCPSCDGSTEGCPSCVGGTVRIESCPREIAGAYLSLYGLAELSEKGSWPEAGGVLDQTEWWRTRCMALLAERANFIQRIGAD